MSLTQGPPFNVRSKREGEVVAVALTVERLTVGRLTFGTLTFGTLTFGSVMLGALTLGTLTLGIGTETVTGPAFARSAPANAVHRVIDATVQAPNKQDRNLTALEMNLLDLPMDCPTEAAVLSRASTQ